MSYEIEILIIFIYNPLLTSIFSLHVVFKLVSDDGLYMKPSHAAPTTINMVKFVVVIAGHCMDIIIYAFCRLCPTPPSC